MDLFGLMRYLESISRTAKVLGQSKLEIPISVVDQIIEKFRNYAVREDDMK